ncbi:50S ribosomal protein L28 [Deinococcus yavapaiensis]|uniref:Large ribosomal subunit protein bL28 n=1 Tax=Deinococcus yavapaiensis KR-236 TaxID=694435 RepID=A0A318S634_9DEIO|nr:50S ribosomal protein L28 [Deinococcus yavapaiensis]PYE53612.1 LSU ribosomal protein L28P [Deinococcus yavapaiensis KR-236]
MAKKCFVTGKSSMVVNSVTRRGKAKAQGGVGRKTTGISKRRQHANLQKKTVLVDGEVKRVWISTKALRRLPENIQIL